MMKTKYTLEQLEEIMNKGYKGELDFGYNSDLILHDYDLPENLHVKGDLFIENSDITFLPKGLKVRGSLTLFNTGIIILPDNLEIGESLYIGDCEDLSYLPKGLKIKEDLFIGYCNIKYLPEDLEVGRELHITIEGDEGRTIYIPSTVKFGNIDFSVIGLDE